MPCSRRNSLGGGVRKAGRRLTAAAVFLGACLTSANAVMAACAEPAERTAFEVRRLQTELMVAALSCDLRPEYNAFVRKFGTDLNRGSRDMRSYFRRAHGGAAESRLTTHLTAMANEAALQLVTPGAAFCERALRAYRTIAELPPGQLQRALLLLPRPDYGTEVGVCTAEGGSAPDRIAAAATGLVNPPIPKHAPR